MQEKTKSELISAIETEITETKKKIRGTQQDNISDATNRVAVSNLYIALSNLIKN